MTSWPGQTDTWGTYLVSKWPWAARFSKNPSVPTCYRSGLADSTPYSKCLQSKGWAGLSSPYNPAIYVYILLSWTLGLLPLPSAHRLFPCMARFGVMLTLDSLAMPSLLSTIKITLFPVYLEAVMSFLLTNQEEVSAKVSHWRNNRPQTGMDEMKAFRWGGRCWQKRRR